MQAHHLSVPLGMECLIVAPDDDEHRFRVGRHRLAIVVRTRAHHGPEGVLVDRRLGRQVEEERVEMIQPSESHRVERDESDGAHQMQFHHRLSLGFAGRFRTGRRRADAEMRCEEKVAVGRRDVAARRVAHGDAAAHRMTAEDHARVRLPRADRGDDIGDVVFVLADVVDIARPPGGGAVTAQIERPHFGRGRVMQQRRGRLHLRRGAEHAVQQKHDQVGFGWNDANSEECAVSRSNAQ